MSAHNKRNLSDWFSAALQTSRKIDVMNVVPKLNSAYNKLNDRGKSTQKRLACAHCSIILAKHLNLIINALCFSR